MIHKEYGQTTLLCDRCEDELGETFHRDNFRDLIDSAQAAGWSVRMENGNWRHYCPECRSVSRVEQAREMFSKR